MIHIKRNKRISYSLSGVRKLVGAGPRGREGCVSWAWIRPVKFREEGLLISEQVSEDLSAFWTLHVTAL